MLSANPSWSCCSFPSLTLVVYPACGRLATPLRRMCTGMFLAAFSFIIVAAAKQIDGGAQVNILWQVAPYIVITIAGLISTTGLEFAFREAAPSMKHHHGFLESDRSARQPVRHGHHLNCRPDFGTECPATRFSVTPQMFLFMPGGRLW